MLTATLLLLLSDLDCATQMQRWARAGTPAPCVVLKSPGTAAAQKAWGLSPASAKCAADAFAVRENNDRWEACALADPEADALWLGFFDSTWHRPAKAPPVDWKRVEALISASPRAVDRAIAFFKLDYAPGALLTRIIQRKDPKRLVELLNAPRVNGTDGLALGLPLLNEAWAPEPHAIVASAVLRSALDAGYLQLAAEVWLALPAAVQAAVVKGPLELHGMMLGKGVPVYSAGEDLRPTLALALWTVGKPADAKKVFEASPAEAYRGGALVLDVVRFHVTGMRTISAWDATLTLNTDKSFPLEALPALGPYVHPYEALVPRNDQRVPSAVDLPDAVRARMQATRAVALKRVDALPVPPKEPAVVPVPTTAPMPFTVAAKPWSGKPGKPMKREVPGFQTVRAEESGPRWVVLATSKRLDPMGEVTAGGYWLLVSANRGKSWDEVYLGLRVHRPYRAKETSKVPLLDGDTVRLEADDAPLDDAAIVLPPVGLRPDVVHANVLLEASLTTLKADTDGDGVADLVEARTLSDPKNADTDGDGRRDGDDPTPRLADSDQFPVQADILDAFFEDRGARKKRSDIIGGRMRPPHPDELDYLVGEPAALRGFRPPARVFTLSPGEAAGAFAAFGRFFPLTVRIHLSEDGQHALVVSDEGWMGAVARADLKDGQWVIQVLDSWAP